MSMNDHVNRHCVQFNEMEAELYDVLEENKRLRTDLMKYVDTESGVPFLQPCNRGHQARINAALALHYKTTSGEGYSYQNTESCAECETEGWPCPTVKALQ